MGFRRKAPFGFAPEVVPFFCSFQNYLVFVKYEEPKKPTLTLQISSDVNGPYKMGGGASIDEASRMITLGQAGTTQFYRLSGSAVKIKSIQVANGQVTLKYE